MQIDWDEAPEWAEYWAMDECGGAHWHEKKPRLWNIGEGWALTWASFSGDKTGAPSFCFDKKGFRKSVIARVEAPSPATLNALDNDYFA